MGVSVTIRVLFPDGRPASGAQITGVNHDAWSKRHRNWSGSTDPKGVFAWENLDKGTRGDRYTFSVEHTDDAGGRWHGEVSERIRGPQELLVVLQRRARPTGEEGRGRRLAAIMFTDIVGFTRVAQLDEARALALLELHRKMLRSVFERHRGIEIKTIGDGFLVEFESTLDAARCAIEIQEVLSRYNQTAPAGSAILVRIGIHVGDVVHDGGDILGDAVNIAARIWPLAEPGGICLSEDAYAQVRSRLECPFVEVDPRGMKSTVFPVHAYKVVLRPDHARLFPAGDGAPGRGPG